MADLLLDPSALADVERILTHLVRSGVDDAGERVAELLSGLDIPEHHPLVGRPAPPLLRELVIGRRSRGCVALYRYDEARDRIIVLAIRGQREAGYRSI